ncbi:hypothetical protein MJD09_16505 [bacterium]|nr:hypothetical protein [bacterium]
MSSSEGRLLTHGDESKKISVDAFDVLLNYFRRALSPSWNELTETERLCRMEQKDGVGDLT